MDDTLSCLLKLAAFYGVPVPAGLKMWLVNTTSGLNVRSSPEIADNILRSIPYLTQVTILDEQDGWAMIAPGQWVAKYLLRKVE